MNFRFWSLILTIFLPILVWSQPKPPKKGQIDTEEIVIEKSRAITLAEAERNFEKITTLPKKAEATTQAYEFTDYTVKLPDLNSRFRVLQMPTETPKELTGNYVKLALGNWRSAYIDAFVGAKRKETFSWNAHAKILTFGSGPVHKINSATREALISGNMKYIAPALTAAVGLELKNELYHFYGTQQKQDRKDIRQSFNTVAFKTSFTNNVADSPLDYKLNFSIHNISDAYKADEFELGVSLDGRYKISESLTLLTPTDGYFAQQKDNGSIGRNMFRIKPQVRFTLDKFLITAGLNIVTQNDTTTALKKINLYPAIEAQMGLGELFTLFGGFTGDMQRNNFRQMVHENPFVNNELQVFNTDKAAELYGGIKRQLGGVLSFNARTSFGRYKNMGFFVNSVRDSSRFDIQYNTSNTTLLTVTTELGYDAGKNIRISGKADFYKYGGRDLDYAWHRPTFVATVLGKFAATEKLLFNTEIYYLGGIQARKTIRTPTTLTFEKVALDPVVDINLKAEYVFLEKFSGYLSLNNLLASQYQRYLYYPSRGFTIMIGGTYSF